MMTAREAIDLVRAEIERLMGCVCKASSDLHDFTERMDGELSAYEEIIDFLDDVLVEESKTDVDLEKFTEKIDAFKARYKHPERISVKGAMAFMARMFYQYPNVARRWYEQLPKATMDNERKED